MLSLHCIKNYAVPCKSNQVAKKFSVGDKGGMCVCVNLAPEGWCPDGKGKQKGVCEFHVCMCACVRHPGFSWRGRGGIKGGVSCMYVCICVQVSLHVPDMAMGE